MMQSEVKVKDLIPIPDLVSMRRILCVQPHPDDAEIGAGATAARLIRSGSEVVYLTVTDGGAGTEDASLAPAELVRIRRHEGEEAARLLGVEQMIWLDFPDGGCLEMPAVREKIIEAVRRVRPDMLMVIDPWLPYEAHSDHRTTGLAAAEAVLLSGFPHVCPQHLKEGLTPHAPQGVAFYGSSRPNTFIDVTATWPLKLEAIAKHKSQFNPESLEMLTAYLTAKAREHAAGKGFELAEAFKVLSPIHLHFFEDAWQS
jgi:LmbE family N-acetylglucosaminyl deacetylase